MQVVRIFLYGFPPKKPPLAFYAHALEIVPCSIHTVIRPSQKIYAMFSPHLVSKTGRGYSRPKDTPGLSGCRKLEVILFVSIPQDTPRYTTTTRIMRSRSEPLKLMRTDHIPPPRHHILRNAHGSAAFRRGRFLRPRQ